MADTDTDEASQWSSQGFSTSSAFQWPTIDGPLGLQQEEALKYARAFYLGGFAMLPWLWLANCLFFWPILVHRQSDPLIRPYVVNSGIGFVIFTIVLLSWAITFAIGGQGVFGTMWRRLAVYNIADRLELQGAF